MFFCSNCDNRVEWVESSCPNCGAVFVSKESYERDRTKDTKATEDYKEMVSMKRRLGIQLFFLVLAFLLDVNLVIAGSVLASIVGCSIGVKIFIDASHYLDLRDRIHRIELMENVSRKGGVVYAYLYEKAPSSAEIERPSIMDSEPKSSAAKSSGDKPASIKKPLRSYEIYCYFSGAEVNKWVCAFCDGENEEGSADCKICGYPS